MASKPGFMYEFPWEPMGNFKYLLLAPFAACAALGLDDADNWCWHMVTLVAVRYALAQLFITASRLHAISGKHRIQKRGIDFEQMDREDNWDDFLILQVRSAGRERGGAGFVWGSGFCVAQAAGGVEGLSREREARRGAARRIPGASADARRPSTRLALPRPAPNPTPPHDASRASPPRRPS